MNSCIQTQLLKYPPLNLSSQTEYVLTGEQKVSVKVKMHVKIKLKRSKLFTLGDEEREEEADCQR